MYAVPQIVLTNSEFTVHLSTDVAASPPAHHDLTQPLLPDGIVAGAAINVGNVLLLFCGGQFRDPPGSTTFSVTERYF